MVVVRMIFTHLNCMPVTILAPTDLHQLIHVCLLIVCVCVCVLLQAKR